MSKCYYCKKKDGVKVALFTQQKGNVEIKAYAHPKCWHDSVNKTRSFVAKADKIDKDE